MRTNKMLAAVVAVFVVTWTPFHVHSVVAEFRHDLVSGRFFKLGDVLCRVLAFSSACVNPVLYGWMNDNYRAAFVALITRRRRRTAATAAAVARSIVRTGSVRAGVAADPDSNCPASHRSVLDVAGAANIEQLQLTPLTKSSTSSQHAQFSRL